MKGKVEEDVVEDEDEVEEDADEEQRMRGRVNPPHQTVP